MLVLLTRVLLWASVGLLIWYILTKIIPSKYLTWLGGVILLLLLVASFIDPNDGTISIIWRILSFPLTPLGAAIVFLGVSLSDGINKIKGQPAAIALAILLFSSVPLFAQWLVSDAEQSVQTAYRERAELCGEVCRNGEIPQQGNLAEAAAVVVMGESTDIDRASSVFESPADVSINTALAPRLTYAASLYQQARSANAAPVVIVTAGPGTGEDAESEASRQIIRNILTSNGVFSEDIIIENTGLDVYRTGLRVEDTLQKRNVIAGARNTRRDEGIEDDPRVFIVAPAIVMARAALTFEKLELQSVAKPTDFYAARLNTDGSPLNRLPDLLPSVDALQLTTRYWNELLTSMYYFLRGWLPGFNFGWDSSIEI
jgi:uncharacterized SAM-binding protein YcdF (DUF218 family)